MSTTISAASTDEPWIICPRCNGQGCIQCYKTGFKILDRISIKQTDKDGWYPTVKVEIKGNFDTGMLFLHKDMNWKEIKDEAEAFTSMEEAFDAADIVSGVK